ncbi:MULTISPECIES: thiamine pyrophosphate-dependent enzyme [Pseudomonas]|uniref:thiamine pyrophosphate-dependent enzyme n=1 Tax=Pseudomonas TaxID=286 RepID=UPI0007621967|nr:MULTISPECIES: thiamine pyrophosphate-dependent enzyme [Pseudomonas]MBI6922567.1 hypothetical protein [Pseudomonas monteilii]MBM3112281.1 thiamine pyrophosphate-binding protein [Pseudomonas arcuscaelestis]MCE0939422.1 thiamine pyrophosphate-dependent enzyme [Pseudomonas kurunegalensis]MCE0974177.1 thiamine pyrophosphate-dependent enzyme [Pseudomonas putida]HDS1809403.1 hypothetical protein [Pseudomonas putida]
MLTLSQACQTIQTHRADHVVVTTMGAMNATDKLSPPALTVACVPLMGGAASIGLGLALARPERKVIVLDGDASLLMELGGLVSVAQAAPENFVHVVMNNSVQFAGLGNLQTPGHHSVDYPGMAKAAGYKAVYSFEDPQAFENAIEDVLSGLSPAFVELRVSRDDATLGDDLPAVEMTDMRFTRMGDELRTIRQTLLGAL